MLTFSVLYSWSEMCSTQLLDMKSCLFCGICRYLKYGLCFSPKAVQIIVGCTVALMNPTTALKGDHHKFLMWLRRNCFTLFLVQHMIVPGEPFQPQCTFQSHSKILLWQPTLGAKGDVWTPSSTQARVVFYLFVCLFCVA